MNYLRIYNELCDDNRKQKRIKYKGVYYESHHIIPKWLGGSNDKENLVLLTAREHYIAHYLLFKHYKDKQSSCAFHLMNNTINNNYRSSKKYAELREHLSVLFSGENNPSKKAEVREKISKGVRGDKNGMFGRVGKLNPAYGMKHSKEFLRKKQILHSFKVIAKEGNSEILFDCVKDCADHFKCTKKNIYFRDKKDFAKFGKFKNIKIEICR